MKELYNNNNSVVSPKNTSKDFSRNKNRKRLAFKQKSKETSSVDGNTSYDSSTDKSISLRKNNILEHYNILVSNINYKIELEGDLRGRKFSSITDKKLFYALRLTHSLIRSILQNYKKFVLSCVEYSNKKCFCELQTNACVNFEKDYPKISELIKDLNLHVKNYLDKIFENRELYLLNKI